MVRCPTRHPLRSGRKNPPALLAVVAALAACAETSHTPVDDRPFVALVEGRALDGREGLEVYAPEARGAVLEDLEAEARYWAGDPEATAELERLLADGDPASEADESARYLALQSFVARNAVMTETHMFPGLRDLRVDGDRASAVRVGENPGGEFRERVRFVRVDARWYRAAPAE